MVKRVPRKQKKRSKITASYVKQFTKLVAAATSAAVSLAGIANGSKCFRCEHTFKKRIPSFPSGGIVPNVEKEMFPCFTNPITPTIVRAVNSGSITINSIDNNLSLDSTFLRK